MTVKVPESPSWKFHDIIIILLIINVVGLITGYFSPAIIKSLQSLLPMVNHQMLFFFLASIIQAALFIGLAVYFVVYRYGEPVKQLGITSWDWQSNLTRGFFWGLALFCIVVGTGALVNYLYPIDPEPQPFAELIMQATSARELIIPLIMGSILAPIGEEVFFRGFVYPVFRRRFGIFLGIVLSSLVFSVLHFDLIRTIPIAIGGMGLAWLYERNGSLVACIVAHSVWNTIMTVLIVVAGPT